MTDLILEEKNINPENARRELARRELARRHLINYAEYMAPWYSTQRFHKLIAQKLEDVERYVRTRGKQGNGRLIVEIGPQYGKTTLISRLFPSWFLGKNADRSVMLTSYGAELAHGNSQQVRDFVGSKEYANIFGQMATVDQPVDLSIDSRAKSGWDLAAPHRGGLAAAGVGGPLTGKGADLLIVDDPIKDREEADSDAVRKALKTWWSAVALQRLRPFGAIIIVMTRWHPDDVVGYLLREMVFNPEGDQYEILCLPTIAPAAEEMAKDVEDQHRQMAQGLFFNLADPLGREPGEVLVPVGGTPEEVLKKKANTDPFEWMAQHQQTPRSRTGGFFAADWPVVDKAPEGLQWFRLWDLAVSPKKKSDRTCSAAIALDAEGAIYVRDMVKWRASWPISRQKIIDYAEQCDPGEIWGVEQVAFQLAAFQELVAEPKLATRAIFAVVPEDDKVAMALPLQSRQSMGKVALVRGPWIREFEEEAALFPRPNEHDDQIDTITKGMQLYRMYMALFAQQEEQVVTYDERVRISPV